MCGFAGIFAPHRALDESLLQRMGNAIAHRGPDDSGQWLDAQAGVGLAHRRLSIVDLSPAGHQPMLSHSTRYVIAFNGEIYNHNAMRASLPGVAWRGHSDTETLLAAFDAWGVEATLTQSVGMFAFALWDRHERCLFLARDRLGEKPLYYGGQNGVFLFGSELKSLRVHPAFEREIDRDALTLLLRHNYIPAPYSIYRGIQKLPPGTFLKLCADAGGNVRSDVPPVQYWSASRAAAAGEANLLAGSESEIIDALEARLRESIGMQMMADVPLGAFLSGGIDSSTVVALMQAQSTRPVKTFTIGFSEAGYNEAVPAKAVARHLGTDHTELYVTPADALAVIPSLPALYDEPFSDSSQIPTHLVSRLARQHVTVSLSGDGGDELFGGYNRYFMASAMWRNTGWLPRPLRQAAAAAMQAVPAGSWDALYRLGSKLLPKSLQTIQAGDKAHKLAQVLAARGPEDIYRRLISHWKEPEKIVIGGTEPVTASNDAALWNTVRAFESKMMLQDTVSYLPDDILAKVDRAAMAVSLETRVPLLDHRVVEMAWRLPLHMKLRNGQGKWALRQVLYRHVPRELVERPKMGFGVPIDAWLRGPLREWAEALLDEARLRREGFFNPQPIRSLWTEHLAGKNNWQYYLWDVLMFQAWLEKEKGGT